MNLFAYVSFFPQLVAGPIERATSLLPQFENKRVFNYERAVDGCRQMLWGFFKKIAIADLCASSANNIFSNYDSVGSFILIIGAVLFTFQIYGDFSGYSDIAIGCSKLFGINLMRNFNIPYFSRDIAEFWRRWHISLTTWFRDYVYIPLGGSRGSRFISIRNTFIIFLISGFWHGANWTFVVWGAYHAVLFIPLLLLNKNRRFKDVVASNRLIPSFTECYQMLITFIFVAIGWIIFRAPSIGVAFDYIYYIFTDYSFSLDNLKLVFVGSDVKPLLISIPTMLITEWRTRNSVHGLAFCQGFSRNQYRIPRWLIYYVIAYFIIINISDVNTFIYFQF